METSLHRELKLIYGGHAAMLEVRLDGYRIDAVVEGELVEIQHGSLAAIRPKIRKLLENHNVRVVKPIVARKLLIKQTGPGGKVTSRRLSPKRGVLLDVFHELIYFTGVFPHPRLTLEVPLVEVEEWRYPGHGRRRRRRDKDHIVEDQKLVAIHEVKCLQTAADLFEMLGCHLPKRFHTGDVATALGISRHVAQRIAYCFRHMGTARQIGKQGNAHLYELIRKRRRAA